MYRIPRALKSICLAAGLAITVPSFGCAGRVRIYDEYHGDYHHWGHDEDRAYHRYYDERHEAYRDYHRLNKDEQKNYWNWRHDHPDNDRH